MNEHILSLMRNEFRHSKNSEGEKNIRMFSRHTLYNLVHSSRGKRCWYWMTMQFDTGFVFWCALLKLKDVCTIDTLCIKFCIIYIWDFYDRFLELLGPILYYVHNNWHCSSFFGQLSFILMKKWSAFLFLTKQTT